MQELPVGGVPAAVVEALQAVVLEELETPRDALLLPLPVGERVVLRLVGLVGHEIPRRRGVPEIHLRAGEGAGSDLWGREGGHGAASGCSLRQRRRSPSRWPRRYPPLLCKHPARVGVEGASTLQYVLDARLTAEDGGTPKPPRLHPRPRRPSPPPGGPRSPSPDWPSWGGHPDEGTLPAGLTLGTCTVAW